MSLCHCVTVSVYGHHPFAPNAGKKHKSGNDDRARKYLDLISRIHVLCHVTVTVTDTYSGRLQRNIKCKYLIELEAVISDLSKIIKYISD